MARGLAEAAQRALYSDGQWCMWSFVLTHCLKNNSAIVLNTLINEHRKRTCHDEESIIVSRAYLEYATNMDASKQLRAISDLRSQGLIDSRQDSSNQRHFTINWQAVIDLCEGVEMLDHEEFEASRCGEFPSYDASEDDSDSPPCRCKSATQALQKRSAEALQKCSAGDDEALQKRSAGAAETQRGRCKSAAPLLYQEDEEERRTLSAKPTVRANGFFEDDLAEDQRKEDYADHAARQLADSLLSKRKLLRKPSLTKWAKSLRSAMPLVDDGPHHLRFKKVMDWYCENIGGEYIPQAYSANSFIDKFPQIEAAMVRSGHIKEDKCKAQARRIREKFERDRAAERLATV